MISRVAFTALALATACCHTTVDAQRNCTQSPKPLRFKGLFGQSASGLTADECQQACARNNTCVAYSLWFSESQLSGMCQQYVAILTPTIRTDFDLAPSNWTSGRCGTQLAQLNGDFNGNDMRNVASPDAVQCSYTCEETLGCKAYTWTTYNNGTCWMKRKPTILSGATDGSAISGEVFKCDMYEGNDMPGGDFASVQRADWRDCCSACSEKPGCIAVSWSDYNGGTCWLKNRFNSFAPTRGVITLLM